jgi:hypothetical protein
MRATKNEHHHTGSSARVASCLLFLIACSNRPTAEIDTVPAEVRAYARARCQRLEACECQITNFDDRKECEDRLVFLYQEAVAERDSVDLDCFGDAARLWEQTPCDDLPRGPRGRESCSVTTRTDAVGEPCHFNPFHDAVLYADTCSEELYCSYEGYCTEPVSGIEVGMPCSPDGLCGADLTCIGDQCEHHRAEGEPCETSLNCAPARDVYCHDGVCVARKDEGTPCTSREECELGDSCFNGQCTQVDPVICLVAEF